MKMRTVLRRLLDSREHRAGSDDAVAAQIGALHSRLVRGQRVAQLRDAEFRVFSQWGEDGIVQYLLGVVDVPVRAQRFVEFGVESYRESNTRFLLTHDNWEGLILDGGAEHLQFIEESELRWRHTIEARQVFITRENIQPVLEIEGFASDLGLLSIDIDGNDYWVWEALGQVDAWIVAIEYNSVFGPDAPVSVPYDPSFERTRAHPSSLYWGASLAALVHLGDRRGYRFVGSNSAGNNAFFVRADVAQDLPSPSVADEWVASRFRESRDGKGALTYVTSHSARRALMADMPLVDVVTGARLLVGDL